MGIRREEYPSPPLTDLPLMASGARSELASGGARDTRPQGRDRFSGLGRVARSRSDAPDLTIVFPAPVIIIGTIGCIGVLTIRCTCNTTMGIAATGSTSLPASASSLAWGACAGGARRHGDSGWLRGGEWSARVGAQEERRSRRGARRRRRRAKRGRTPAVALTVGETKEKGHAAEATRPVVAMRLRRRRGGRGCRASRPCRRGCR